MIPQEVLQQMTDCMECILLKVKPGVLHEVEETYAYNWITMHPFVNAAYTYEAEKIKICHSHLRITQLRETVFEKKDTPTSYDLIYAAKAVSLAYVFFALWIEVMRPINAKLLLKQGLLDFIVILNREMDDGWYNLCQFVQEEVRKTTELPTEPNESSITKAKLARSSRENSGQISV